MAPSQPIERGVFKGLDAELERDVGLLSELLEQVDDRVGEAIGSGSYTNSTDSWF
jgi:hypothetical protein